MHKRLHASASSVEPPVTRSRSTKQDANIKPASLPSGNIVTQDVVNELSLQMEPYGA